jgi:hypothetical protein
MRDSTQPTQNWILGPGCLHPLSRLWSKYKLRKRGELSQLDTQRRFSEFRLKSLGLVDSEITKCAFDFEQINIVASTGALERIEERFKDQNKRSLQGLLTADIDSRILVDVGSRFPHAEDLTRESIVWLNDLSPWTGQLLKTMISWVIPIYHEKYNRPFRRGFSHLDYLGVIFTTFVERGNQCQELRRSVLAVDLAHELGHQALMLYQLTDKILATPLDTPVYSSVRRTDRPAIFALHACVAAAYMIEVCAAIERSPLSSQIEREFAHNSISELVSHQSVGLESLGKVSTFTQIGQLIFDELNSQLIQFGARSPVSNSQPSQLSYFGLLAP